MDLRNLGRTGIRVSPLCLGAMMFGAWGNPDHDDCIRIIHRALDAGINFIDTADVYSKGESEEIVGKALRARRDEVVLATKVHGSMGKDPNAFGNSRRWIMQECENSLRRLGTDWIDLYQIHRPEPDTDIDETLGALSDLVRQGKVRYLGSSTFLPSQIVQAQWTAERRVRERFVSEQPPYSILVRGIEAEVLPVCHEYGMGVIPVEPAGGRLAVGSSPGRPRAPHKCPHFPYLRALRHVATCKPAETRGGGAAVQAGGRLGPLARAPRRRVREPASGRHRSDHRSSDDGTARIPGRSCRRPPHLGGARRHRLDRPSRDQPQPFGRGVATARLGRSFPSSQTPG